MLLVMDEMLGNRRLKGDVIDRRRQEQDKDSGHLEGNTGRW